MLQISRVQHGIGVCFAEQLGSMLKRRSRSVILFYRRHLLIGCVHVPVLRHSAWLIERKNPTVPSTLRINRVQKAHHTLHDVLMIDHRLLHSHQFLQQHRVVDAQLVVPLLKLLELLLRRHQLGVDKVHLLRGDLILVRRCVRLPGCRSFTSDVV